MKVTFKIFQSSFSSWNDLAQQAADFATRLRDNRLINISHAVEKVDGTIIVWYWE